MQPGNVISDEIAHLLCTEVDTTVKTRHEMVSLMLMKTTELQ